METKYWRSINELQNGKPIDHDKEEKEHKEAIFSLSAKELNAKSSRRNFLKFMGFSVTAASLAAACERPVNKAIPFLIKPENIIPGKATFYASTYMDGSDYCSILVKVRDGRPIKIEGNELSPVTKGGTSARVQASVLSLYDSARLQYPTKEGKQVTWEELDKEVIAKLQQVQSSGGTINLVTKTVYSPSTQAAIDTFKRVFPSLNHVAYEPVSASALIEANGLSFNAETIPDYRFEDADLVVGFNADFLGTWIFPLNFAPRYISRRRLSEGQKNMSRHIQYETTLTITGSKADKRVSIRASDEKLVLAATFGKLAAKSGTYHQQIPESPVNVDSLVEELYSHRGKSIVMSGSNEVECQLLVNAINQLLGNIGTTIDFSAPIRIKKNKDTDFAKLMDELNSGRPQAIILYDVNPAYDYPDAEKFTDLVKKASLSIGIYDHENETAPLVQYVCPAHHFLESWNDAEPKAGFLSVAQPTIQHIFETRHFQENLLKWAGNNQAYYDFVKSNWLTNIYPRSDSEASFDTFWTRAVQDGVVSLKTSPIPVSYNSDAVTGILPSIKATSKEMLELHFYENISVGNGAQGNNPWLQELPDPISKVTWENYAAVSPKLAKEKGWQEGSIITINKNYNLPVVVQPGQNYDTISVALGYGHTNMGKVANGIGINAYKLQKLSGVRVMYYAPVESYVATGEVVRMAQTQEHDSMEGRPIVRETNFTDYVKDQASGTNHQREFDKEYLSLYDEPKYDGYHWGMSIDLNSCIGCGACVIGCQSENNIPVVGKKQVTLRRAMHWIRIDRYYSENPQNPKVFFQPMTCQQCDQAPCENVCPVSATNHSNEGLSQMAYNRCVGTKYCINNCPYKVRRFNWYRFAGNDKFDYNMNEDLGRMVLNPDVTVRERGVVEKCTFCVQRIQEKKLQAKLENKPLKDIELLTACAQACPTRAIRFGNTLDKESIVARLDKDPRNYHVLEELHTLPSIGYLTLVRNMKKEDETA
ncbi:MAG TPA: TAT-variant-translocated molybdopterin oxidoreductase [Bacteroidales bacterium]|nr:TAT-variant-translocated molybdopterin oxidoreductase [Bacteroidales bacterium]